MEQPTQPQDDSGSQGVNQMSVFKNRDAFIKAFNSAKAQGYSFTMFDEEMQQQPIETAEAFIDLAADYEICTLDIQTPNHKTLSIFFATEYDYQLKDAAVEFYDYSSNEELETLFKDYLAEAI